MNPRIFLNPHAALTLDGDPPDQAPLEFHRRMPGYAPTRLAGAPGLAALLGVGAVWVKDESSRFGLPAFKILGASWATYLAQRQRLGHDFAPWETLDDLKAQLEPLRPLALAAATDGNHGRAVAHMARLLGLEAHIFVPAGTAAARIQAIEGEGAAVTVVDGTYDDAVARSAEEASERCLVISDTAWPGYEQVPRWVIDGYSTIFREIDDELARRGEPWPDLVAVQIGVGALAAAVVRHYRGSRIEDRGSPRQPLDPPPSILYTLSSIFHPRIVGVEPTRAAAMLASMQAGRMVEVPGPHDSIMAGLNCGAPSPVAWPVVSAGIDLFVAVEDERARQAMRALAADGIVAGETGAAGAAGLLDLLTGPDATALREALGVTPTTRVLLIATEGATDPESYARIVSQS
jgi:diaminopropionate ammonia-lyase